MRAQQSLKMHFIVLVVLLFQAVANIDCQGENDANNYYKYRVVPDILNTNPVHFLDVDYGFGVGPKTGKYLRPSMVNRRPINIYPGDRIDADPDALFSLLFIDADYPTAENPTGRSYVHWFMTNIKGSDFNKGTLMTTDVNTVLEFEAPDPKDHEYHRYIYLMYRQDERLDIPANSVEREGFDVENDFQNKYQLFTVDYGNFYRSKYEE